MNFVIVFNNYYNNLCMNFEFNKTHVKNEIIRIELSLILLTRFINILFYFIAFYSFIVLFF